MNTFELQSFLCSCFKFEINEIKSLYWFNYYVSKFWNL